MSRLKAAVLSLSVDPDVSSAVSSVVGALIDTALIDSIGIDSTTINSN